MHFGKRLTEFIARDGRLKPLSYKQLKQFIKSGQVDGFMEALDMEIASLNGCISEYLVFLELRTALVQQQLLQSGVVFKEDRVRDILEFLNVTGHLTKYEAVAALAKKELPADVLSALAELVDGRNGLLEFVEINACGLRKIVKKFSKRAVDCQKPNYKHAIDAERIITLVSTVDCLADLAEMHANTMPERLDVGEELKLFIS